MAQRAHKTNDENFGKAGTDYKQRPKDTRRPYTEEEKKTACEAICKRIKSGESIRSILMSGNREAGLPSHDTFFDWVIEDKNVSEQYARAMTVRAEVLADGLLAIADGTDSTGDVNRDRLRVDTRKWYLSKVNKRKYGDSMQHEGGETPITINLIRGANKETQQE